MIEVVVPVNRPPSVPNKSDLLNDCLLSSSAQLPWKRARLLRQRPLEGLTTLHRQFLLQCLLDFRKFLRRKSKSRCADHTRNLLRISHSNDRPRHCWVVYRPCDGNFTGSSSVVLANFF